VNVKEKREIKDKAGWLEAELAKSVLSVVLPEP